MKEALQYYQNEWKNDTPKDTIEVLGGTISLFYKWPYCQANQEQDW